MINTSSISRNDFQRRSINRCNVNATTIQVTCQRVDVQDGICSYAIAASLFTAPRPKTSTQHRFQTTWVRPGCCRSEVRISTRRRSKVRRIDRRARRCKQHSNERPSAACGDWRARLRGTLSQRLRLVVAGTSRGPQREVVRRWRSHQIVDLILRNKLRFKCRIAVQ